jgi:uncharacterized protein (DUF302 family)
MAYYFSKILDMSFEEAKTLAVTRLQEEGFGIITEIDVKATFKKKIDVDFRNYHILGACSPMHAYKALTAEDKVGTMLPCNVIVQELEDGRTEVAAIDPVASMMAVDNIKLGDVAVDVQRKLAKVIEML